MCRRCTLAFALCLLASPLFAGSSNSLLDLSPDGSRLLVTNADNGTVSVVDLKSRKVLHEIPVGEKPEGVTWIGDGPLAAVAVYRDDLVVFLDTQTGKVVHKLIVYDEPYGIVANKAGTRLWVTHEYPGKVSEIDVASRKVVRELPAGPFIRGIALSNDESRLYVTGFYSGILHAIDLASGKVVDEWKGHSTDNLCRSVVLHPRRSKAYLTHIRSMIDRTHGAGSIFPHVSIRDLVPSNGSKRGTSIAMDTYNAVYVPTNSWESAISPDGRRYYTLYAGTNDMNVSDVIDDDYKEIERVGGSPVQVGQNPRAVRVSPDSKTVYVYNTLDFEVTLHDADGRLQSKIKVCDPPKTPEWVRGKILFNSARPPMSGRRWVSCSSCHPDGHHDGRVWQNPEGTRKTTALFGMAHTHPLHWSADRDEVQDFEYTIRSQLMQGRGLVSGVSMKPKQGHNPIELEQKTSDLSPDLDALAIYSNSFEFNLSPHALAPGKLSAAAERGKASFHHGTTGCATCHGGPYYTDSTLQKPFKLHDVGTGTDDPREKMGPKYDTPTLLGAYRNAPYLHHGKAATLHEVFTTYNQGDKHGKTSHLKKEEIDDLVEFLKALPYEKPPDETPNTVKHRVVPKRR